MMASQTNFSIIKLIKLLSNHLRKLILIDTNTLSTYLFFIKIITFILATKAIKWRLNLIKLS